MPMKTPPDPPVTQGAALVTPPAPARLSCLDGLDDFAAASGTSSDDVLAVMSFLLAGMAGPEAWLGGHNEGAPLAKLDLLVRRRDGALGRMAGQLVAKLRGLNRSLTAGMADYSMDWIRLTRRGAFAGGSTAKFADPEDTRQARERLLRDLREPGAESHALRDDLEHEKDAVRIEALLHPQFLLESVRCRELQEALDLCHQRTAVVVGLKTAFGRAGSEPARDLRGLLDLMEGLATPRWEGDAKGETGRSRVMPLKAHVLLEAGDDDLAPMVRLLPDLAGRFLWLIPAGAATLKPPRRSAGTAAACCSAELIDGFTQAAMEILGQRRLGATVVFSGVDVVLDYARYGRVMDRYRRWLGYLGELHQLDPGPAVCELPGALGFGLGFLCRQGGGKGLASSAAVMAEAFRSARRLARRHCRGLALHLKAEQIELGVELARQIVSKLEEKGPMSRRQLVRCFSNQRWKRFESVIGALTGLGLLAWGEENLLEFGDAEIFEVEDRLREALLAPPSAHAGVSKAAKPNPPTQAPPKSRAGNGKNSAGKATKSPGKPPGKSK